MYTSCEPYVPKRILDVVKSNAYPAFSPFLSFMPARKMNPSCSLYPSPP